MADKSFNFPRSSSKQMSQYLDIPLPLQDKSTGTLFSHVGVNNLFFLLIDIHPMQG